ncbi:cytochrome P450 [Peziza echinospora]|nr:cytochrome P450 [Peziza echinospora]
MATVKDTQPFEYVQQLTLASHLSTLRLTSIVFGLFASYYLVLCILQQLRRRRLIAASRCQKVAHTLGSWPFGLDILKATKNAFATNQLPTFYDAYFRALGNTWAFRIFNQTMYFTCEPRILKFILSTHPENFPSAPLVTGLGPLIGKTGIFSVDGVEWEHSRALLKPQFTRAQVTDFQFLEKHFSKFLANIFPPSKAMRQTVSLDIHPLFFDLTLNSASQFLFGESVNSLSSEDRNTHLNGEMGLGEALSFAQSIAAVRAFLGVAASWVIFGRDAHTKFYQACSTCHTFVDFYVDKAISLHMGTQRGKPDALRSDNSTKEKYVALNEFARVSQDRTLLRDNAIDLIIAGRDTTANFLSWTMYVLARDPRVFSKLRTEIVNELGDGEFGELPSFNQLKNLKYLRWVLKEVLRLYPVTPFNRKVAAEDIVLPAGGGPDGTAPLLLKKGQMISYSMFSLHRRKDLYGEDADDFRPERWGDDERLNNIGWGYLPFSGGPRICIGQHHAMNEASYVTARIIQSCRSISLPPDIDPKDPEQYEVSFAMGSAKGVHVQLTKAY